MDNEIAEEIVEELRDSKQENGDDRVSFDIFANYTHDEMRRLEYRRRAKYRRRYCGFPVMPPHVATSQRFCSKTVQLGTPKGRLTRLEQAFLAQPWQAVRPSVTVKLLAEEGELYILVRSDQRRLKERGMRWRRLKTLWQRLGELQQQANSRDQLLLKLGAAKQAAGRAWALVDIGVAASGEAVTPQTFTVRLAGPDPAGVDPAASSGWRAVEDRPRSGRPWRC